MLSVCAAASLVACAIDVDGGRRPRPAEGGGTPSLTAGASTDVTTGCTSDPVPAGTDLGTFDLAGDGFRVRLSGAPADPAYEASYPIEGLVRMVVRVQSNTQLATRCITKTGEFPCQDHPFYSRARSGSVEVFDVYGKLVLDAKMPAAPKTCAAVDAGTQSCPFLDDIRRQFCADVNAEVGTTHAIDCDALEDVSPATAPTGSGVARACIPLVEPAMVNAGTAFEQCAFEDKLRLATWHSSARAQLLAKGACTGSPLVVDLDGRGLVFSAPDDGVTFDLFGDGTKVRSAWPIGNVAFVALDANGDGKIVASELFGSATDGGRHADGFEALREHDANGDLRIDRRDPVFAELRLWTDRDRDGESSTTELSTLGDHDIEVLDLRATRIARPSSRDVSGNEIPLISTYRTGSGRSGSLADVFFRFTTPASLHFHLMPETGACR